MRGWEYNPICMGLPVHVVQLIRCLNKGDSKLEFYIFVRKDSPLKLERFADHIRLIEVRSRWISAAEQIEIPKLIGDLGIKLFHAPSFVAPFFVPCNLIMTIHDLNHMVLHQHYTLLHQLYYRSFVRRSIRRSAKILTVSEFSKNEIIETFGLNRDRIVVTYNGVSKRFRPKIPSDLQNFVRDQYDLPREYILCVANNKPHKNLAHLVLAFVYAKVERPLVLLAPPNRELLKIADAFGKKHLLYFIRYVEDVDLPAVYTMASLFVYPSVYVGFGLPPLEALACGVPSIVADCASLPEVVGPSGLRVEPNNHLALAQKIENVIDSLDGPMVQQSIEAGLKRAETFSWENMAQLTTRVTKKLLFENE